MKVKIYFVAAVLLLSFRLSADEVDPAVNGEVEEALSAGQKSTLAIMLKAGKLSIFNQEEKSALPAATDDDKKAGFILFKKQFQSRVFYNYRPKPEELRPAELAVTAAPGEYAPLVAGIYPFDDGAVKIEIPDLMDGAGGKLPASCFEIRSVKHMLKQEKPGLLSVSPEMMIKENPVKVNKGVTRQAWISVTLPPDAKPGAYSSTVSFSMEGKAAVKAIFKVTVLPFKLLDDPSMGFGWFGSPSDDLGMADYRRHGCNMVNKGLDPVFKAVKKGKPVLDFTKADKNAEFFKRNGMLEREAVIGVIRLAGDLTGKFKLQEFSPEFNTAYKDMLASIRDWAKEKGIKPVFWLLDEPREKMIAVWNRNLADTLKYAKLAHEVEGIKTMVDPMSDKQDGLDYTVMVDVLDVLCPHAVQGCAGIIAGTKEQKKELWLYNSGRSRLGFGFIPWKHNAKARIEWAYAWGWTEKVSKDPQSWSTSRGGDPNCGIIYPTKDEILPTPYYEITKEGIVDYKYAYTLETFIKEALSNGSPEAKKTAEAAKTVLDRIKEEVPPYTKGSDLKASEEDLSKEDEWRSAITAELVKLAIYRK